MFNKRFTREAKLAGFEAEGYFGRTFTGDAVICRDADAVVRLARSTSDPLDFEPLPAGGFLVYAKQRAVTDLVR